MPNNLLITGPSGTGKSTALCRAVDMLSPVRLRGFVSSRIIRDGEPMGWRLRGLNSTEGMLAHSSIESSFRLGHLGVDMEFFDEIVGSELIAPEPGDVFVVDEIGVIGGWSPLFVERTTDLLNSTIPLVAVVRQKSGLFEDSVRARTDTEILTVTAQNREAAPERICEWVKMASQTSLTRSRRTHTLPD